ncbi:ABC transporter ATP-binding protein [Paraliobacillus sp. JSM ZJ581]|uniref:ABC transporter ATP-binding protein n=1 Tax=Paraliobacillus sp. JSM ZJ581 TaxID=3342118 RepID=UPI0035A8A143
MSTLKKLQTYMVGRKILLPGSLILSGLSAIAGMIPYILIWFIIRELFTAGSNFSSRLVTIYGWWALATAVASIVLYFIALTFSHLAAFRVETNMRRVAMEKVIHMPLGFFNKNTTGRIRKIIDDNASVTHGFVAHQMPDLAATILMPLTILILIFIFDWRLGLACLVPIIFSFFIMGSLMSKKGKHFLKNYMTALEHMNTEAVEYVRGIPVVKVFQQTVFSFKNFYNSIIQYKNMVFAHTKMWEKSMSAYTVVINSFVFILVPVAILIMNATSDYTLTMLNLFLYVLITPVFSQCIMRSMHLNQAIGQANEAVTRIDNLAEIMPLSSLPASKPIKSHHIQFKNVSFSYPDTNNKAVNQVSFTIPEGKTIALVGASGSGKTTIARLLPRFWDVDEGEIFIGETNIKDIDPKELMNHISFVFQNTRLFKTTLLENIKYGNPSATDEAVENAIDKAQCREIINKLPDGLNTKIGTEGTYLSGGEQQRIVLARAILKDAPIVILDEATAFADPENEHLIQEAFKKLTIGKTVLMIAHRLTSVTSADNILVISEGEIIEQGTHAALLQKEAVYASMWKEFSKSIDWKIGKEEEHYA